MWSHVEDVTINSVEALINTPTQQLVFDVMDAHSVFVQVYSGDVMHFWCGNSDHNSGCRETEPGLAILLGRWSGVLHWRRQ